MLKNKFKKTFLLLGLVLASTSVYAENFNKPNLNYELKVGITPFESYGSSTYSERFDKGVDFGLEVYKPLNGFSLGFGGEVKKDIDAQYIIGDTERLYTYYFLGKKEITDSYSIVTRLGRTSQKEFDSKFYGAIGLEKNINRVNVQLLYEQTKLKNSYNNKDYSAVGLKVGYVFGDQYKPKVEAPIMPPEPVVLEEIKAPEPILTISGDELTGQYPAYSTEVPTGQIPNIQEVIFKLNEYDKAGTLEMAAYSDNSGSKAVNVKLANERMDNLSKEFKMNGLTEKIRIEKVNPEETVQVIYKVDNDTFENRQLNRRIEVTFIED